jgi:flavin-binding protein dodecin
MDVIGGKPAGSIQSALLFFGKPRGRMAAKVGVAENGNEQFKRDVFKPPADFLRPSGGLADLVDPHMAWRWQQSANQRSAAAEVEIRIVLSLWDTRKEEKMADSVYKVIELVGSSEKSWEEAARNAVERAGQTLRDLRVAEINKLDMKVENGKVTAFRARVNLSFKYGGE